MRIAYITAGAAGMFCGSCMHDNTLVAALTRLGHDALLVPTYTPLRTDEPNVSQSRVFFGGINVYLQDKLALFRHTPWLFDRLLDAPRLLRWVSRFAVNVEAQKLGALTVSILEGEHGHLRKEVIKLASWLADEVRPEVVTLTAVLLSGLVHEIKQRVKAPLLVALQGDDLFLEGMIEPYRQGALELIRVNSRAIDGFLATSNYYADFMASYLGIPRERIHVVWPGLNLAGHGGPRAARDDSTPTIGYFARVCREKGLHVLVDAFRLLRQSSNPIHCRLRVSGWLGKGDQQYFDDLRNKITTWGLADDFAYVESPDHVSKVRFLQDLDVLSVPTTYREPKGLYVLEALANGVPVVQPRHGSFPELIAATGGGLLCEPNNTEDLAHHLRQVLENEALRRELGQKGKEAVHRHFHAERMAQETAAVFQRYVDGSRT